MRLPCCLFYEMPLPFLLHSVGTPSLHQFLVFASPPPPVNLPAGKLHPWACKLISHSLTCFLICLRFESCFPLAANDQSQRPLPPTDRPLWSVSCLWDSGCPWESPEQRWKLQIPGYHSPHADFMGAGVATATVQKCHPHFIGSGREMGSPGSRLLRRLSWVAHARPFTALRRPAASRETGLLRLEKPGSTFTR